MDGPVLYRPARHLLQDSKFAPGRHRRASPSLKEEGLSLYQPSTLATRGPVTASLLQMHYFRPYSRQSPVLGQLCACVRVMGGAGSCSTNKQQRGPTNYLY